MKSAGRVTIGRHRPSSPTPQALLCSKQILPRILRVVKHQLHVHLVADSLGDVTKISAEQLSDVRELHLECTTCDPEYLSSLFSKLPKTISIVCISRLQDSPGVMDAIFGLCQTHAPQLTEIVLDRCPLMTSPNMSSLLRVLPDTVGRISFWKCPGVKTLDFSSIPELTDQILDMVIIGLTQPTQQAIPTINLSGCVNLTDNIAERLSYFVISQARHIDLSGSCFTNAAMEIFLLRMSPQVEWLSLRGCSGFDDNVAFTLAERLIILPLVSLDMSQCDNLSPQALQELVDRLPPRCTTLAIGNDTIDDEAMLPILRQLPHSLKYLRLYGNKLTERTFSTLLDMRALRLDALDLRDCIGLTQINYTKTQRSHPYLKLQAFIKYLPSTVEDLDLSNSSLDDTLVDSLVPQLGKCKKLNISGCTHVTVMGLWVLVHGLSNEIITLDLTNTCVGDTHVQLLVDRLGQCKHLSLGGCKAVTVNCWHTLIDALPEQLAAVNFSGALLQDSHVDALMQKLRFCRAIHLNQCEGLSKEGWAKLVNALPHDLVELGISHAVLDDHQAIELAQKLQSCARLVLPRCRSITTLGWQSIVESLPNSVQRISLGNSAFRDTHITILAPKLAKCTELDLSGCGQISSAGWETLLQAYPHEQFSVLHLSDTSIQGPEVLCLAKRIKTCHTLNLSQCTAIDQASFQALAMAISDQIEDLDLSNTQLEDAHVDLLADKLSANCTKLNLSHCKKISPAGWHRITSNVSNRVEALNLSSISLDDDHAVSLAEKLAHCKSLNLGGCTGIGIAGWNAILQGLGDNTLEELICWGTHLENAHMEMLAKKLPACRRINLDHCTDLTSKGLSIILNALPTACEELSLSHVSLSDDDARTLVPKVWDTMRALNLSGCTGIKKRLSWSSIITALPNTVQELRFANTPLHDEHMEMLAEKLSGCRGLNLSGCSKISRKGLDKVLAALPSGIEVLDLSATPLQNEQAVSLSSKIRLARIVKISKCKKIGSTGWSSILENLSPDVRELDFSHTSLSDAQVNWNIGKLVVERLNITGCSKLSPACIERLRKSYATTRGTLTVLD